MLKSPVTNTCSVYFVSCTLVVDNSHTVVKESFLEVYVCAGGLNIDMKHSGSSL